MAIKEDFSLEDLDLSLVTKDTVEQIIKTAEMQLVSCFVDAELHKTLAINIDEFIDEEDDEENKKQLELTKESYRQKRLANIKMIWQWEQNIKTLKDLLSKF